MGGGARAAYSVGFLRGLADGLPGEPRFPILSGVSAGAINVAYLASRAGSFRARTRGLSEIWRALTPESVMRVGSIDFLENVVLWGFGLLGGGSGFLPRPRGLVDCSPLWDLLREELADPEGRIRGLDERLEASDPRSVLVSTCSYTSGEWVVWSEGRPLPESWAHAGRRTEHGALTVDHVIASGALPIVFPAVRLGDEWHGDGEIRSSAPLSPCVALGAERILAVSTHHGHRPSRHRSGGEDHPSPGRVAGTVMNSPFLHDLANDARRLRQVNELVDRCGGGEPDPRRGEASHQRKVGLYVVRPSRNLEEMAAEHAPHLPWTLRHMIRGLGTDGKPSAGLVSLLSFQPEYLHALMELGEEDAARRIDRVQAFLEGEDVREVDPIHGG